jgi:hypothetical protein
MSDEQAPPEDAAEDVTLAFGGDITDYWTFSLLRDYLPLMPGLSDGGARLYVLLRTMISETKKFLPGAGLRRMTIDQLCFLMPGSNGKAEKPVSVSTMYEYLKNLEQLQLVVPRDLVEAEGVSQLKGKDRAARGILRGYTIKDLPPATFTGWRNAWDKLDHYTPDWRTNPVDLPTHLTSYSTNSEGHQIAQVWVGSSSEIEAFQNSGTDHSEDSTEEPDQDPFQNSGTPFPNSGTTLQDSGTDPASTCGNGTPLRSAPKKSFSLSAEAGEQQESAAPEAAEERENEASPTTDTATAEPTDDAAQVLAAYEEALGGPALNGTRKQFLADAAELLAARPLWWVIARAQELPKYGSNLAKHASMSKAPFATKTPAPRQAYTSIPTEPERGPVSTKSITSLLDALQSPSI